MIDQLKHHIELQQANQDFTYYYTNRPTQIYYYRKTNYRLIAQEKKLMHYWSSFWNHIQNRYFIDLGQFHIQKLLLLKEYLQEMDEKSQNEIDTNPNFMSEFDEQEIRNFFTQDYQQKNPVKIQQVIERIQNSIIFNKKQQEQKNDGQIFQMNYSELDQSIYLNTKELKSIRSSLTEQISHLLNSIYKETHQKQIQQQLLNMKSYLEIFYRKQIKRIEEDMIIKSIKNIEEKDKKSIIYLQNCHVIDTFQMDNNQIQAIFPRKSLLMKKKFALFNMGEIHVEMCHYCRTIKDVKLMKRCQTQFIISRSQTYTQFESPYLYLQIVYSEHINQQSQSKYYLYKKNQHQNKNICNRYFCQQCLISINVDLHQDKFICIYCKGVCDCERCRLSLKLIKLKAAYIRNKGDIKNLQEFSIMSKIFKQTCSKQYSKKRCRSKSSNVSINQIQQQLRKHYNYNKRTKNK